MMPEAAVNGAWNAPEGYKWVLTPAERPEGSKPARTYAWRVFEDEEMLIDALTETFASKRASEALRWLLEQPAVRQTMFDRIRGAK